MDCERVLRSAGSFDLKFFCPDPFAYALADETFTILKAGDHTITRTIGNMDANPIYRIKGAITTSANNYISIVTNGAELRVINASLTTGETLVVDTERLTAYVEGESGSKLRNGLPYLQALNFPTLQMGDNKITIATNNANFTSLTIRARSRWR